MSRRAPRSRRFGASVRWSLPLGALAFSRSSEASYLTGAPTDGSSAFLAWASNDVLRFENRGDGAGALALFEGSRTNQTLRSQAIDDAAWTTAGAATITAGLDGPDGATAERVEVASGTNIRYQNLTPGSGLRAYSAWVRATAGTPGHYIYLFDSVTVGRAEATLSTTYARLAGVLNCAAGAGNIGVADGRASGGGVGAGARDVRATLVQLEAGAFPSSAIRTAAGTATRSADTATAAAAPRRLLTGRGEFEQVSPIFAASALSSGDVFWLLSIGGGSDGIRIRYTGTDVRIEAVAGGAVKASSAAQTWSAHALLGAVSWDPAAGLVYVNGTSGAAGTAWSWSSGAVRVGGIYGGASEAFCRLGSLGGW